MASTRFLTVRPVLRSSVRATLAAVLTIGVVACKSTNVVPLEVATVEISPPQTTMLAGERRLFEAIPRGPGGERLLGRSVSWTTRDPDVAQVSPAGEVRAREPGAVQISASIEGVSGTSQVTVLPGPEIELSPTELFFNVFIEDSPPRPVPVMVRNAGGGILMGLQRVISYKSGSATGWLAQTTLNASTAPTVLVVRVDPRGLEEGVYTADIEVQSSNAINSPQEVEVTLGVGDAPPAIQLSQDRWEVSIPRLTPTPVSNSPIDVRNAGGGRLTGLSVVVDYDQAGDAWLTATLDDDEAPTTLNLTARAGTLLPGEYTARARVSADVATNSPQEVEVRLTITAT